LNNSENTFRIALKELSEHNLEQYFADLAGMPVQTQQVNTLKVNTFTEVK
jgi:hypothetical protein